MELHFIESLTHKNGFYITPVQFGFDTIFDASMFQLMLNTDLFCNLDK